MAEVNMDVDATLLSRGMMFCRQKRASRSKVTTAWSECADHFSEGGFSSTCVVTERGYYEEEEELAEFRQYVARDLPIDQATEAQRHSPQGTTNQCLLRTLSFLFEHDEDLKGAVYRLGNLGDSIDGPICKTMRQAVKSLGDAACVDAKDLDYEEYKKAAAPFVDSGTEEWMSVAKLFRFTEELLTVNEGSLEGEVDPVLQQKLEDYNSRVLVDLASAFMSRAGGLIGLVNSDRS